MNERSIESVHGFINVRGVLSNEENGYKTLFPPRRTTSIMISKSHISCKFPVSIPLSLAKMA
jgi:hypothetical protein